jgi:hypothetical protein
VEGPSRVLEVGRRVGCEAGCTNPSCGVEASAGIFLVS